MDNQQFMQTQISNLQNDVKKLSDCIEKMLEHSKERDVKIDAMYNVFTNGNAFITVVKWAFGLLLTIGGAYLLFKNIFFHQ